MTILTAKNLTKHYQVAEQKVPVITDASLVLNEGEFVTLLGPSGSGKSTLLNLCGLLDDPDAGELYIHQQAIHGMSKQQRSRLRRAHLGFVFQSFNLIPVMTAADNVAYPLMLLNESIEQIRQKTEEVLAQVGLADCANKKPGQLSGGQCQRLAIARALIKKPSIIIADEPTASLDADTAMQVIAVMQELAKAQGTACLIATHDERVLPFSDRLLHVEHGRLVEGSLSSLAKIKEAAA